MTRSFVLGIDCKLYMMPPAVRVTDSGTPANNRPKQLMDPTDGSYDSSAVSSYHLMKTVQDVTLNLTSSTADLTNRYSNGWRQIVSALKEGSVDFSILWEPDDSLFSDLLDVYLTQCPAAFAVLDGPIEGFSTTTGACDDGLTGGQSPQVAYSARCDECGLVTGLHADFVVTSFTRNEALEEGVTADVTIEPGIGQIYPEWLEIPTTGT